MKGRKERALIVLAAEIEAVLALGVSPDRIVYANPCKVEAHIGMQLSVGSTSPPSDSREEVEKIMKVAPQMFPPNSLKAPDDGGARCPLGPKCGALPEEVTPLLQAAHAASSGGIRVSFHVGGGATHSACLQGAIAACQGGV
ncbi:hypothetical protein IFM89_016351 [Coptis chinensis]|uniref:Orn/DAP/Arg decarboxylase 2 N-terminal domain-containing protein n=1 Tax=Coptis chinensis TaxID=261450 RepID=A0A835HDP4_9MAGN|nr:hypothetical protein IFM89_016351 [Coptis chinensis]